MYYEGKPARKNNDEILEWIFDAMGSRNERISWSNYISEVRFFDVALIIMSVLQTVSC